MFSLTMSKQSALAQLKACESAMLVAQTGELMAYAVKGKLEALRILNAK